MRTGRNQQNQQPAPMLSIHRIGIMLGILMAALLATHTAYADPKVKTAYLYDLKGPTKNSEFNQHNGLFCDAKRNEVYVVDTGNHCVRIFGKECTQVFEFGRSGELRAPLSVAVNSLGDIYVLQNNFQGQSIDIFDFRGKRLGQFVMTGLRKEDIVDPVAIIVDSRDVLYVSDPKHGRLLAFDMEGRFLYALAPDMSEKDREEVLFGNLMIDEQDSLYLPVSTLGSVYVFDSEGRFVRNFGIKGGGPGKLAFPVDVVKDNCGHLLVLDKQRHCINVYDSEGNYLTEFGGYGISPGWFFYPGALEIDRYNRIYVSQRFREKVQVLKLKEGVE